MTGQTVKPFHQWKDEQVRIDSVKHGVLRFFRTREWYFKAYGYYVCKRKGEPK